MSIKICVPTKTQIRSAQADQSLRCSPKEALDPWLSADSQTKFDRTTRMCRLICDLYAHMSKDTISKFTAHQLLCIYGPHHAKKCLRVYAKSEGPDQPAHPRSQIRAFTVC